MGRSRREVKAGRRVPGDLPAAALLSAALLAAGLAASCALLYPRELSVIRFSPSTEKPDVAGLSTWVEFSAAVDATAAEQAFSLTEDGQAVRGVFSWAGNRMHFQPLAAFQPGKDYAMSVAGTLEDLHGVSLGGEFRFRFSTKTETSRPRILAVSPAEGSAGDDRHAPVVVSFSEPMDRASALRALAVSPPVAGARTLSADGLVLTFAPAEPWQWQTQYTVSVDGEAADLSGNRVGETRRWRFFVGTDRRAPVASELRNVEAGLPGSVVIPADDPGDTALTVTAGIECAWALLLSFDEEVTRESLASSLSLEPGAGLEIAPLADRASSFTLTPSSRLAWDTVHTLTVGRGVRDAQDNASSAAAVFLFRTDGAGSRPPRVVKVRFRGTALPEAAAPVDYDPAVPFMALPIGTGSFPLGVQVQSWFDLQLALADGAGIDIVPVLGSLSIDATGGCLVMRPLALQVSGFDDPQPEAVAGAVPLRVVVTVVNAAASGTVSLRLAEGFADSRGNPLGSAWRLPFLK